MLLIGVSKQYGEGRYMVRDARRSSESGIYHVMLRGIDQAQLFYDDNDRYAFMERLERARKAYEFCIYAYCLMANHVHLLIREGQSGLSVVMKSIATSYARYFNIRYDRTGYLFQGRYKSEPVETDAYLLELVRYIHNNPVKIGESIGAWTSYNEYMDTTHIIDPQTVLSMFSDDGVKARLFLSEFLVEPADTVPTFISCGMPKTIRDVDAIEIIKRVGGVSSPLGIRDMEKGERDRVLANLRSEGISIRQLSRLTGISKGIIQRIRH
jgi:REP element-mobilizing transposase RayT